MRDVTAVTRRISGHARRRLQVRKRRIGHQEHGNAVGVGARHPFRQRAAIRHQHHIWSGGDQRFEIDVARVIESRRDLIDTGEQLPKPRLLLCLQRCRDDLVGRSHHQHHSVVGVPRVGDACHERRNGDGAPGDVGYLAAWGRRSRGSGLRLRPG